MPLSDPLRITFIGALLVALAVLFLDQASKALVEHYIEEGEVLDVLGPLHLTLFYNTGAAFGIAAGTGFPIIIPSLVALSLFAFFLASAPPGTPSAFSGGLLLGGALGNLLDRIVRGGVVDFVALPFWPVFNLADVAIFIGAVSLAVIVIRSKRLEHT